MPSHKFKDDEELNAKFDEVFGERVEGEVESRIAAAIEAALVPIREAHAKEIEALNIALTKAREANATADYSAFEEFPDLVALLKRTDLRPAALPALCALHVWRGLKNAADISKALPVTPSLGDKGGVPSSAKIITSALQKLERGLIAANTGTGVQVTSIRGKEGNSTVRRIKFTPLVFEDDAGTAPTNNSNSADASNSGADENAPATGEVAA